MDIEQLLHLAAPYAGNEVEFRVRFPSKLSWQLVEDIKKCIASMDDITSIERVTYTTHYYKHSDLRGISLPNIHDKRYEIKRCTFSRITAISGLNFIHVKFAKSAEEAVSAVQTIDLVESFRRDLTRTRYTFQNVYVDVSHILNQDKYELEVELRDTDSTSIATQANDVLTILRLIDLQLIKHQKLH